MTHSAQDRLLDLESAVEELKEQIGRWGSDIRQGSWQHRELAKDKIRALRHRQSTLANEIANHRSRPRSRLDAVARELDDLWAVFARVERD